MASMQDIAARAGVSRSTVSFVLNDRQRSDGSISDATRGRILQAAQELGYRPNELARAVVVGRSRIIGFVTATPESDAGMRILIAAAQAAEALGYTVKVLSVPDDDIERVVARCHEFRLAGVITIYLSPDAVERLRHAVAPLQIPVACVEDQEPQKTGLQVGHDYAAIMEAAVAHLWDLGHRRLAFFAAKPQADYSSRARLGGFQSAVQRRGGDDSRVLCCPWETSIAERTVQSALEEFQRDGQRPTALVCATDALALIALRTARRLKVEVPHALSVIGCGNLSMAELSDPPLTTVEQAFFNLGTRVAERLIARAEAAAHGAETAETPETILLSGTLVVRKSTARSG